MTNPTTCREPGGQVTNHREPCYRDGRGSLDKEELSNDVGEADEDDGHVDDDHRDRQVAGLASGGHEDEAGQQEDDDEAADGAGEPDDGADGRVEDGEGDADGQHDQVDGGDVVELLLLTTHDQEEGLKIEKNPALFKAS